MYMPCVLQSYHEAMHGALQMYQSLISQAQTPTEYACPETVDRPTLKLELPACNAMVMIMMLYILAQQSYQHPCIVSIVASLPVICR